MIYVYDGTWSGMLTLVYRTARDGLFPGDIVRLFPTGTNGILLESLEIPTDPIVAEVTAVALEHRLNSRWLSDACLALMSEKAGIDLAVWRFLLRLWNTGDRAAQDLADPCTAVVLRAARQSFRELHRWMGLVRFQDTGGSYYAAFAPECDILPLLAGHFCRRLPDRWMLHDVRRRRAALHESGHWVLTDVPFSKKSLRVSGEEKRFQALWQEFFHRSAVKERRSAKRQMHFLPQKTWEYLIEKPGSEPQP